MHLHRPTRRPLSVLAVVATLTGGAVAPLCAQAPQNPGSPLRTVTVGGHGEAAGVPDRARVRLGVQVQGPTASEALRENSRRMAALVATLREAGIGERQIRTDNVSLWPEYESAQPNEAPKIVRYRAGNTVEVRVDDLKALGGVLDRAVAAGGNTIDGVSFEIAEPAPLLDEARRAAMADARRRADLLAAAAGARLGPVLTIDESGGAAPGPVPMPRMRMSMAASAQDVPTSPGEQQLEANVQVTWELVVGAGTPAS